jgi:hypothetical protein|uniref:Uncharacterized protein n=1 Tax=Panagrolaimus sp. PS1159 TaxID=55785 RepID=A0AC35FH72_9BILA
MARWSNTLLVFSVILISSNAQFNPYQQRYQYGNNNINNNLPLQQQQQQQQQLNRPYGANNQRFGQAGQPMYSNQQQQPQQQQFYSPQQQQQLQQQNQQFAQNQFGQNQFQPNQNRNSGSGGGLLGNPIRPSNSAFGNSSSPDGRALFGIRIVSYAIGRVDPACATTTCSYSFSIVMATLSATVNYESSNFFPLNGSSLTDGGWRDEIYLNVSTKPVSVDIFVHSRGLTIGQVDGNYSLGVPVQHVNTFVLDLRSYMPFGQNGTVSRTTVQLQDSKPTGNTGASIQLEYFIQCLNGYLGPDCDYTCTKVGNGNLAQCKSILNPKEQHSCKYDSGYTQIAKDTCDYCSQGFANNGSCLPVGYSSGDVGVSHAYKVWTIVLACLLGIALLLILLLVMLKILTDSRNRRRQQYPTNRNQPIQNGGYRPNAGSGETPLLGGTEKEWERERRPIAAVNRQTLQPVDDSIQNSESFPDNRGGHYAAQSRREAQV